MEFKLLKFFAPKNVVHFKLANGQAAALKKSQLPVEYKNITVADSIEVTVSLEKTKIPASCDCIPGSSYLYNILSIRKR